LPKINEIEANKVPENLGNLPLSDLLAFKHSVSNNIRKVKYHNRKLQNIKSKVVIPFFYIKVNSSISRFVFLYNHLA